MGIHMFDMKLIILIALIFATFAFLPVEAQQKCSKKAFNFCRMTGECSRDEYINGNKKNPNKNTNRRKYCKKVKCVAAITEEPCVCSQVYDPVCDLQGNLYSNQGCAVCEGADIGELGPCFGNGVQTFGPM